MKKSSKMAGKDGQTCPNVEMQPDLEHMHVCMHGVPEGDGRRWWALNGCTNQPEGWPLGPVVGQTAPGAGMAGMDGVSSIIGSWGTQTTTLPSLSPTE